MIVCIEKGAPAYGGIHCCPVFKKIAEGVMAKNHKTSYEAAIDTTALRSAPPMMQSGNLVALNEVLRELRLPHRNNYQTSEGLAWGASVHQGTLMLNNEPPQKGLPSVIGYGLRDAVYRLERMGVKVKISGFGRVVAQSLPPGTPIKAGMVVQIQLSMEKKPNIDLEMSEESPLSPETTTPSSGATTPSSGASTASSNATAAKSEQTSSNAAAKTEKKSEKKVEKKILLVIRRRRLRNKTLLPRKKTNLRRRSPRINRNPLTTSRNPLLNRKTLSRKKRRKKRKVPRKRANLLKKQILQQRKKTTLQRKKEIHPLRNQTPLSKEKKILERRKMLPRNPNKQQA